MSLRRPATCALLLAACGGSTTSRSDRATAPLEPTARDSAGVAIHEHAADALERAPVITVDSVPLVEFAGSVDDVAGDVSSLSQFGFTSTGDLVAFDGDARQIVVLPADGTARRVFGRSGAGPGELGGYGALVVTTGDTMIFSDGQNDRLAIISPTEGVVRELSLAGGGGGGASQLIGRTNGGTYYFQRWSVGGAPGQQSGLLRQPVTVQTWRGGPDPVTDRFVGGELPIWREVRAVGRGISMMIRDASLTVQPQMRMWGQHLLTASGTRWSLEQRDSAGTPLRSIRINRPARPLTEAVWSSHVEQTLALRLQRDSTIDQATVREQIAAEEHQDSLPVFSRVVVTPNQVAWVEDYRLPGDTGWAATALDLDGRILGRIVEPTGDPPVAFGNDRVAFRTEDEDGIATITVKKVTIPGP